MRVGTQARIVKDAEGLYMVEVYMNGHYRTRYIDCTKAPHKEWKDIISDNIAEVEDRIDMDIELEEDECEDV